MPLFRTAPDRPAAPETAQRRRLSCREAIAARLVEQAEAGELRATKLLLDLAAKARRAAGPDPVDPNGDDEDPREVLQRKLARLADAIATPEPNAE